MSTRSTTPAIIAVLLLLLPVVYGRSYLALVVPGGIFIRDEEGRYGVLFDRRDGIVQCHVARYRAGSPLCKRLFWPLEQIDWKLRPREWQSQTPEYAEMVVF